MRIVMFYHSLISDWNHGNAHFLRGIVTELLDRGHDVTVMEPLSGWSRENLVKEYGSRTVRDFFRAFPHLSSVDYDLNHLDLDYVLENADLVIVHEWNEHELVRRIGMHRKLNTGYKLLFHDTHHRSITDRKSMELYDLSEYDGVLAFGEIIRRIYLENNWTHYAWTWHEAVDTNVFRPFQHEEKTGDLVWVGNWGDEERTAEIHQFLLEPVKKMKIRANVYGVRYPNHAYKALDEAKVEYRGWLANYKVPQVFARNRVTVHIPRRPYVELLPGIPTIRPFEAMACGIPLICSPWRDEEKLFKEDEDYLIAYSDKEMKKHLLTILNEPAFAKKLTNHARQTVLTRHTCTHRVDELMAICKELNVSTIPEKGPIFVSQRLLNSA